MATRPGAALLIGFLALGSAASRAEPTATPAAVVTALYKHHLAHDMAFTPAAVAERSKWLAPDLLATCRAYFARPKPPDEVPDIDGDPFTDSQEYPTRFRLGETEQGADRAVVPVVLSWPGGATRTVHVHLARIHDAWLVTDVAYASGPSLRTLLGEGR